jgi:hypothetical protein
MFDRLLRASSRPAESKSASRSVKSPKSADRSPKIRAFDFDRLLNWRLLQGSHVFPGTDGGTCINEAAIVAAGYEYRRVQSVADLPPTFSLPVCNYAMGLNDCIGDDELRQELMLPFVGRLAGSADSTEVETRRTALIIQRSVADLLPLALEAHGLHDEAKVCRSVTTVSKANQVVRGLLSAIRHGRPGSEPQFALMDALAHSIKAIDHYIAGDAYHAAGVAAGISWRLAHSLDKLSGSDREATREDFFRAAAGILDDALAIGRQGEPIGLRVIANRMDLARRDGVRAQKLAEVESD